MTSTPRASGSIVAAGIFAILGGVLGALFNLAALILFSFSKFPPGATYPDFMRPVLYVVWIFFLFCALFLVVVGVQVIRLQNWARIALLIIAGCLLFFGVIGIAVIFVTIFGAATVDPVVSKAVLASVLAVTYGIPIAIALWWLILLTRPFVISQFHSSSALNVQSSAVISRFHLETAPEPSELLTAVPAVFSKTSAGILLWSPVARPGCPRLLAPVLCVVDYSRIWASTSQALELSADHCYSSARLRQRPRSHVQPKLRRNGSFRPLRHESSRALANRRANAELFALLQPAKPHHSCRNPDYPARSPPPILRRRHR